VRGQRTINKEGKIMKAIANKEIFIIIITVGSLLLGNGYMVASKQYQDFYQGVSGYSDRSASRDSESCL
jgi:hypothetical protein